MRHNCSDAERQLIHMQGLVLSFGNQRARVRCEDGEVRLCTIKGKRVRGLEGWYNALAAGDVVKIQPISDSEGVIEALIPRKNVFGRFNEKGSADQAFAANIDVVVCVASVNSPPFRPRFIDRISVLAEQCGVPLIIACNKVDLGVSEDDAERLGIFEGLGFRVIRCSAMSQAGTAELKEALRGKVSVFIGQSGVGKSSLINMILPDVAQRTGEVSEKYNRGKHTTTLAVLLDSRDEDFNLIDTPGFRSLAMRNIEPDQLSSFFPEMLPLLGHCDFGASCSHTHEEGCAVMAAVERGGIFHDRYESYLRIRAELEGSARRRKKSEAPRQARNNKFRYEEDEW